MHKYLVMFMLTILAGFLIASFDWNTIAQSADRESAIQIVDYQQDNRQEAKAVWRRTPQGWVNMNVSQPRAAPSYKPVYVHPLILVLLQIFVSLGALVAFQDDSKRVWALKNSTDCG